MSWIIIYKKMWPLHFYLFGSFTVDRGGQPLSTREWRSRQNRGILKVLIARRGNPVSPDQLIDIFWPDQDPLKARRWLHVRLSQLRHAIDPSNNSTYIITTPGGYLFNLNSGCWIDVVEFERLVEQGRRSLKNDDSAGAIWAFEKAVDLYRGDFLQDDLYEDWTTLERERLHESYLSMLSELAEIHARVDHFHEAVFYCQKILSLDTCREAVYVQLMLYHYYSGENAVALRAFDRCRHVLWDELGIRPSPETIAIADQIRRGALQSTNENFQYTPPPLVQQIFEVPASLIHPPFIGRIRELTWLVHHWKSMHAGVIMIEGEAGIGKTRLVNEFIGYVETGGSIILKSRSSLRETSPYSPIIAAFRSYPRLWEHNKLTDPSLSRLVAFFPELNEPVIASPFQTSPDEDRTQVYRAFVSLVDLAFPSGVSLFIDDAHSLDETSMELLDFLSDTLVVILCCRSEETPSEHRLRRLMREKRKKGCAATLNLEQLISDDVSDLINQMASRELNEFSKMMADMTRGNPLFLVATLQHLFEEGRIFVDNQGRWDLSDETVPTIAPEIRKIIESRLGTLDHNQRQAFDFASVIGRDFDFTLIQRASQVSEDLLLEAINDLIQAALLIEPRQSERGEFASAHDLYTQVAYSTLPSVRRRQLHLRVADALSVLNGHKPEASSEIAHHYHLGENLDKAVHYAVQAGKHALRLYAGKVAIRHFDDALEWIAGSGISLEDSIEAEIHYNLGDALRRSGRYSEAKSHFQKALEHAEIEVQQDIAFQISFTEVVRGANLEESNQLIQQLEERLKSGGDSWGMVGLLWHKGYLFTMQAQAYQARSTLSYGWRMAHRLVAGGCAPPEWLLAKGYLGLSRSHEFWADWPRAIHFADKSQVLYSKQEDYFGIVNSRSTLGMSYYGLGFYDQALSNLEKCIELTDQAGDPGTLGEVLYRAGLVYLERGDWAKVEDYSNRAISAAQSAGDLLRQGLGQLLLARLSLRRFEPLQAISVMQLLVALARSAAEVYIPVLLCPLAEAHWMSGDISTAKQIALEGIELAATSGFKREWGGFQRILGDCWTASGDFINAEEHLRQALTMAQQTGCRFDQAKAHSSLGRMYQSMNNVTEAEHHQKATREICKKLGIEEKVL